VAFITVVAVTSPAPNTVRVRFSEAVDLADFNTTVAAPPTFYLNARRMDDTGSGWSIVQHSPTEFDIQNGDFDANPVGNTWRVDPDWYNLFYLDPLWTGIVV
jgi:hypothetical protein